MMKCTGYDAPVDWEEFMLRGPCHCPNCGGFLTWNEDIPICNKCKTELIKLPEIDEETGKEMEWGKICPISLPSSEVNPEQ